MKKQSNHTATSSLKVKKKLKMPSFGLGIKISLITPAVYKTQLQFPTYTSRESRNKGYDKELCKVIH